MKMKRIFPAFALSTLVVAGALAAVTHSSQKAVHTKATTDVGEVTISEVRNAISDSVNLYLLPNQNYSLPDSWDYVYTAVGDSDGVYVNGTKYAGAVLKYANTGSAFITFHFALPSAAQDGTLVEFIGEFTCAKADCSFSIHYATHRFGGTWVHALESYDTVSLADANMPNFSNVALNTDDMGSDYSYVTDPATLPMKKGFFGLTNDTGSYAFQFNYKKTSTGTGWFHVLIGGQGPLWRTGHFFDFGFLDNWANTGHAQIHEYKGKGNNWEGDLIQETDAIALGWNVGETNLLEMGLIKRQGTNQRFVFFKVNGVLKFGEFWTLDDSAGGMTTKVCLQYGGTDATVSNSIDVVGTEKVKTSGAMTGLYTSTNLCPPVNNWSDFFKSVDGNGLKLNGVAFGGSTWNYFKKTGDLNYYLDLATAGVSSVSEGDVIYIGGIFKAAREVNGVKVLFKVVFADSYFRYDGTNWVALYGAADFSKDLLKLTRTICTGEGGNNHDALVTVWATLADASHWGALDSDNQEELELTDGDPTIVVPSTEAGIDAMDEGDAICAALYRYDYCTAKYSLTNFITGREPSYAFSRTSLFNVGSEKIESTILVVVAAALTLIAVGSFFYFRKRKEDK